MSLIFQQIHTPGIAQLSYLVGDDGKGVACIIDPRTDVDCYLELARKHAVSITHIFETHIHADFQSGALELKRRLPTAKVFSSHEGGARYGFDNEKVKDGDTFEFGDTILTVKHTPGHTAGTRCVRGGGKETAQDPVGRVQRRQLVRRFSGTARHRRQ